MKIIAFIPVRGGSKSIPQKNIKLFLDKPLVYWTLKAAINVKEIDEIIIATDSIEISNVVESFNFDKVRIFNRSNENASDSASTESVILEYINDKILIDSDIFILIQATSPLLESNDLINGLKKYSSPDVDSVVSCTRSKRFFWSKDGTPLNYDIKKRPRRQDFDGLLMENGAFYINSVGNIKANQNRLSGRIGISEMDEYKGGELDEPDDWKMAERLMMKYESQNLSFNNIKIVISDVDGVLTNAGMYYSESGDELKKFNTHDGMAFQLLREKGIKTAIITSEETKIVSNRAKKLKVDHLIQGVKNIGKLHATIEICKKEGLELCDVAYIGDDINCYELLTQVGVAACPKNATLKVKQIPNILLMKKSGGNGAFREFIDLLLW